VEGQEEGQEGSQGKGFIGKGSKVEAGKGEAEEEKPEGQGR